MINFDDYVNENKTKHNKNWPYIADHQMKNDTYKYPIYSHLGVYIPEIDFS